MEEIKDGAELAADADKAAAIAEAVPEKQERPPAHVSAFYSRMFALLGPKGVHQDTQPARSMSALMLREAFKPTPPKPFGKRDRQKAVKKLVEEGQVPQPKIRRTRDVPAVLNPAVVDRMVEQLPDDQKASREAVAFSIGRRFGYATPEAQARAERRARRFMERHPGSRLPSQVRSAAVMAIASAVAQTKLFPDGVSLAMAGMVADLRSQFGET